AGRRPVRGTPGDLLLRRAPGRSLDSLPRAWARRWLAHVAPPPGGIRRLQPGRPGPGGRAVAAVRGIRAAEHDHGGPEVRDDVLHAHAAPGTAAVLPP